MAHYGMWLSEGFACSHCGCSGELVDLEALHLDGAIKEAKANLEKRIRWEESWKPDHADVVELLHEVDLGEVETNAGRLSMLDSLEDEDDARHIYEHLKKRFEK